MKAAGYVCRGQTWEWIRDRHPSRLYLVVGDFGAGTHTLLDLETGKTAFVPESFFVARPRRWTRVA